MKIAVLLVVLAVAAGALLRAAKRNAISRPARSAALFESTASESNARVAAVLPTTGSEDKSGLLVAPELPPSDFAETRDYLPDPVSDWSVNVRIPTTTQLTKTRLLELLSKDWREAHGKPTLYAKELESGRWTYLIAADVPEVHTELALAWPLVAWHGEGWAPPTAPELNSHLAALRERLSPLGEALLQPSSTPEDAFRTAARLTDLRDCCDQSAIIVLAAPDGGSFEGRVIWDVMLSLGLRWGNLDLFHWDNDAGIGDEEFFSVWTTTPPGYFLPEEIAAGQVRTVDLVFGYSIPGSAAPREILQSMTRAARYAQSRLGGFLLDENGLPFDEQYVLEEIATIEQSLGEFGLEPGRESTLRLF
jgi:cell division protein ZipA